MKKEVSEKKDKAGKRATLSGLSWITTTATAAKATRSHATALSRRSSQRASGVIFSSAGIKVGAPRGSIGRSKFPDE
jgi:hypothetical protein